MRGLNSGGIHLVKWLLKNPKHDFRRMSKELGVSELLCRLLVNRGIFDPDEARGFLDPKQGKIHDPLLMKDMGKAVSLLEEKIKSGKSIRIIGDYDVDGIVSTYILYRALSRCGAKVDYDIPHRIHDGYGISNAMIDKAAGDSVDTIITCDNGIAAFEQVSYAKEKGLTVIVTDHHDIPFINEEDGTVSYRIPPADAVINMKQPDCEYPFKQLCGAGVAFKLMQAMYSRMEIPPGETEAFLEYVAIATVCDVVDLLGENRLFVKKGLELINKTKNIGLKALIKHTGIQGKKINVYSLGYILGPCMNASGRLDCALKGLELLLAEDEEKAESIAVELNQLNTERRDLTAKGVEGAIRIIEESGIKNDKVIVVYKNDIHESIAGIVAGKLKDKYHSPIIILTDSEHGVKGSGRSIEEYNMFEALTNCKDLLIKFGGHPMATGLSLEPENIESLRQRINETSMLTEDDLTPKVRIDAQIRLEDINLGLAEELLLLEPFGKGNTKPLFGTKGVRVAGAMIIGANRNIVKLKLQSRKNQYYDCVWFGGVDSFEDFIREKYGQDVLSSLMGTNFGNNGRKNGDWNVSSAGNKNAGRKDIILDIIYNIEINEYNGNKSVQLVLKYFRQNVTGRI